MTHLHLYIGRGALLLLMPAILLASCSKKSTTPQNSSAPRAVQVAEAVTDSVVLYKQLPGVLSSASTTNVVARVNGKLLTQNFTGGQYVNKGQVLFTIESTTYRDAVTRAEASLASARSQRDYYSKQLASMRKALEADAVSKMQVVQAQSNLDQAEAAIREAQATLSTARENLRYCTVTAPASGYISTAVYSTGNYLSGEGAAVTLATIYDNSSFDAVFAISDAQYESMLGRSGGVQDAIYRNVPLTFREPLKNVYTTDLYYVAPSVDEATGSLQLRGTLANHDNELKNGMYVSVSLPYGVEPRAVLVKDASLSSDQQGFYLYTLDKDNKVRRTPVQAGPVYHDSLRVINSGIKAGDRYVTKALLNVRAGETVKPVMTK